MRALAEPSPLGKMEDIEMKNDMKNEQAVSPVIVTILMVAITVTYGWCGAGLARRDDRAYRAIFEGGATPPGGMPSRRRRPLGARRHPELRTRMIKLEGQ